MLFIVMVYYIKEGLKFNKNHSLYYTFRINIFIIYQIKMPAFFEQAFP